MVNALFNPGREGFLAGEIDWDTAVIDAALVRGYTFAASHKFMSDLTGAGGVVADTETLANKTITNGVADADNVTYTAVAANASNHVIVLYQRSAVTGGAAW